MDPLDCSAVKLPNAFLMRLEMKPKFFYLYNNKRKLLPF